MNVSIRELFIYPVKSLRGLSVDKAILTPKGLKWDRHWMIIKDDNIFITQRQLPSMVLVKTALTDTALILSAEGMEDFSIDLNTIPSSPVFEATVWKDTCKVIDEGKAAGKWLTKATGSDKPLRLVRMAPKTLRPQSKKEMLGATTSTFFADAAPYLIANEASLDALNKKMSEQELEPVTIERFRPNIVISGLPAFSEHVIEKITGDYFELRHCFPCQRCVIPTIDIETGKKSPLRQPFSLLAEINAMPGEPKLPAFGENAILVDGADQTICVGQSVTAG